MKRERFRKLDQLIALGCAVDVLRFEQITHSSWSYHRPPDDLVAVLTQLATENDALAPAVIAPDSPEWQAHKLLHQIARVLDEDSVPDELPNVRNVIAEAVAIVVGIGLGVGVHEASMAYLAANGGGSELLEKHALRIVFGAVEIEAQLVVATEGWQLS